MRAALGSFVQILFSLRLTGVALSLTHWHRRTRFFEYSLDQPAGTLHRGVSGSQWHAADRPGLPQESSLRRDRDRSRAQDKNSKLLRKSRERRYREFRCYQRPDQRVMQHRETSLVRDPFPGGSDRPLSAPELPPESGPACFSGTFQARPTERWRRMLGRNSRSPDRGRTRRKFWIRRSLDWHGRGV